ncbi:MAG: N-acetyltransferase [Capsulimonas sp.]|uniref:GNAT family N-acetyltransferase n=1 Tax=Capsulimonas sp. TaxID=2494211 RepID=UPI003267F03F
MQVIIRQENPEDRPAVAEMIKSAYQDVGYSNHREQFMVERLRKSDAFIPRLSLVAEVDHEIAGHIMLTKILIHNQEQSMVSLALAPLSVAPEFQGKGVGGKLVAEAHRLAKELGYRSVIVLGPAKYYPRFGYELTKKHGIELPIDVREENCMVISLVENGWSELTGRVEYSKEFFE